MTLAELNIPVMATKRLVFRPITMADSAGMFELWSDAAVCQYSGIVRDYDGNVIAMPAASIDDSDRIIDFWIRARADGWGFRWSVILDQAFAGTVGFNSLGVCAEIAYHLCPSAWGNGVMTEASRAAIDWVRDGGTTTVEAFIEPENAPSIALARRLGLAATGEYSEGAERYVVALGGRVAANARPR